MKEEVFGHGRWREVRTRHNEVRYGTARRGSVEHGSLKPGSARRGVAAAVVAIAALVLAGCASSGTGPAAPAAVGTLPAAAQKVMSKPAYARARWLYRISDLTTGKVLYSSGANQFVYTASTAKLLTIGTLLDTLGPSAKLTTPVYAVGSQAGGVLSGNLDLVASGDLTLGGREASQGKAVDADTSTTIDQVYGDIAPNGAVPAGDPLAGLDSLASQVAAAGIHQVNGDVVVDDRLWDPYTAQEGPVPAIYVNDNLLDIVVTPGAAGAAPAVATVPETGAYQVESDVKTVAGKDSSLSVSADDQNPRILHLTGTIGASAGKRMTVYRVPDAASWARTLFIEALARAGVTVTAAPEATNTEASLPAKSDYSPAQKVASYRSPPLSALAGFVMRTSYNTGANAFLCLIAVHEGSSDCTDGLKTIHALASKAGIGPDNVILVDGQGGDPASIAPEEMVKWLTFVNKQSWGGALKADLPVLGETGTLAFDGVHSPARGKIAAKTGTSAHADPSTGRTLFNVQALAGYMTAANGDKLVFDLAVSGASFSDPITGITQIGADEAEVATAFQQAVK
jgi:D-alanyl-D-alanine carboxypeptidase/D-alanyl-D-alanine-endopeptidase (penicillin-binding protein 4)